MTYRITYANCDVTHPKIVDVTSRLAVILTIRRLEAVTGRALQETEQQILARLRALPVPPADGEPYADWFGLGATSVMVERLN